LDNHLTEYIARFLDSSRADASMVKRLLMKILVNKDPDKTFVEYYVARSIRNGTWRMLRAEARALLLAIRFWRGSLRSRVLKEVLKEIFLEIELLTLRGKALFYGLLILLRKSVGGLRNILSLKSLGEILVIGLSYINNPPLYRVYG